METSLTDPELAQKEKNVVAKKRKFFELKREEPETAWSPKLQQHFIKLLTDCVNRNGSCVMCGRQTSFPVESEICSLRCITCVPCVERLQEQCLHQKTNLTCKFCNSVFTIKNYNSILHNFSLVNRGKSEAELLWLYMEYQTDFGHDPQEIKERNLRHYNYESKTFVLDKKCKQYGRKSTALFQTLEKRLFPCRFCAVPSLAVGAPMMEYLHLILECTHVPEEDNILRTQEIFNEIEQDEDMKKVTSAILEKEEGPRLNSRSQDYLTAICEKKFPEWMAEKERCVHLLQTVCKMKRSQAEDKYCKLLHLFHPQLTSGTLVKWLKYFGEKKREAKDFTELWETVNKGMSQIPLADEKGLIFRYFK